MSSTVASLFELGMPWWEFVLRAVCVYLVVLLLIRITAKRTIGQSTPFDLLVIVLLGNAVQNSLIGNDTSLPGGLLLAAVLLGLNSLLGRITARWRRVERLVEGEPSILACNGRVLHTRMRTACISDDEFSTARREAGIGTLAEVRLAVLETSGKITFIRQPDTPS
jgi:uncharacterized membrane protein YcaP (DUF421 family)